MNFFATSSEIGIDPTVAGSIVGTYWFLMMIGRLFGASFGAKISSKAMLSSAATVGMIFILIAIFAPATTKVSMPVFLSDISFGSCRNHVHGSLWFMYFHHVGWYLQLGSRRFR